MEQITANMTIGEILEMRGEEVAPILLGMGMHCLGCPMSRGESIEEACGVHDVNCDEIVAKINKYFSEKED